jgi:hypothetical protein
MPRFRINDLLTFILFAGIALAGYRVFWETGQPNPRPLFWASLALLTTATLGIRLARSRWRRFFLGYAFFGWVYLVLVHRGGFIAIYRASDRAEEVLAGILLGVLCGIAAMWFSDEAKQ